MPGQVAQAGAAGAGPRGQGGERGVLRGQAEALRLGQPRGGRRPRPRDRPRQPAADRRTAGHRQERRAGCPPARAPRNDDREDCQQEGAKAGSARVLTARAALTPAGRRRVCSTLRAVRSSCPSPPSLARAMTMTRAANAAALGHECPDTRSLASLAPGDRPGCRPDSGTPHRVLADPTADLSPSRYGAGPIGHTAGRRAQEHARLRRRSAAGRVPWPQAMKPA